MFVNCSKEKIVTRVLIVISMLLAVSACNTVKGIGKDIKKGGEAIEKSVK